jgi:hypothetical protein
LQGALAIAQLARQVGAHVQLVLAHGLLVVHVVEGGHLVHGNGRHADVIGDGLLGLRRDPALLLLDDGQTGHDRRLTLVSRVLGDFAVEARFGLFAQHDLLGHLAVDFTEHDVHRADDGHGVGQHVATRHFVEGGQVREAGGADLQPVGLVGTVEAR